MVLASRRNGRTRDRSVVEEELGLIEGVKLCDFDMDRSVLHGGAVLAHKGPLASRAELFDDQARAVEDSSKLESYVFDIVENPLEELQVERWFLLAAIYWQLRPVK